MKKTIKWGCIAILTLFIVLVILVFTPNAIGCRLYPFSRVKGTIQLSVNGSACNLNENSFDLTQNSEGHSGKVRIKDNNTANVSFRAYKYGKYSIIITDASTEEPLIVSISHQNNWDRQTFDVNINVDTDTQTVTCETKYSGLEENGILVKKNTHEKTDSFSYTTEQCVVWID